MKFQFVLSAILTVATLAYQYFNPGAASDALTLIPLLGACTELNAFRIATESLATDVLRSPRLGRANFWRNLIPMGSFAKNQGVTRSTFQIKASEPQDDQSQWQSVTLSNGTLSPSCNTTYEDVGVGYFERTYSPRTRRFRGPVICKENLTYQHQVDDFLRGYEDEMGRFIARVWEFSLRRDFINFANIYVDGTKYSGPNALATAPRAYEGLSLSGLNTMAVGQINVGAGASLDGYTTSGASGPVFPEEIDMVDAENLFRSSAALRSDANYASMGKDGEGDFAVWKAIGATRTIGNHRFVPTPVPIRLDYNNGAYEVITPFKDITTVGSDGEQLTDAYKNADFGMVILMSPDVFAAEAVLPQSWPYKTIDGAPDPTNYNGELDFIAGGERVCDPGVFDPLHEKGRHFGVITYAPKPVRPYLGSALIYKRCPQTSSAIFCS